MNTTQNTTKHLTTHQQQDEPCHPYPSGFPLSPWTVHQCCPQIIALPLPSVRRSRATGLVLAGIGSLAVDFEFHIKDREREGGTLVLDGCRLAKKSNNQPIVSDYNRGGIGEETRPGRNVRGDAVSLLWSSIDGQKLIERWADPWP